LKEFTHIYVKLQNLLNAPRTLACHTSWVPIDVCMLLGATSAAFRVALHNGRWGKRHKTFETRFYFKKNIKKKRL